MTLTEEFKKTIPYRNDRGLENDEKSLESGKGRLLENEKQKTENKQDWEIE
jgi:hypothetical protein